MFDLPDAQAVMVQDRKRRVTRRTFRQGATVVAAIFSAARPIAVASKFQQRSLGDMSGRELRAGQQPAEIADPGPVAFRCFDVGVPAIAAAIMTSGATSLETLGKFVNAGTNCGSCRPELRALIEPAGQVPHRDTIVRSGQAAARSAATCASGEGQFVPDSANATRFARRD